MKHVKTFENYVGSIDEKDIFQATLSPQQKFALNIGAIQDKVADLKSKANAKPEEAAYINAQIDIEFQKLDVIKSQMQAERVKTQMAARKDQEKRMKEYQNKMKKSAPKSDKKE